MNKFNFLLLIFAFSLAGFAQTPPNRYEVELLMNPNPGKKDTREVNAVIIFEKEAIIIRSRRGAQVFKELKYSGIKYAEHSFSKQAVYSSRLKSAVLMILTGLPIFLPGEEKHWLTVLAENDFAVLKIENDNYRLLKMEFLVRNIEIENINEDRR